MCFFFIENTPMLHNVHQFSYKTVCNLFTGQNVDVVDTKSVKDICTWIDATIGVNHKKSNLNSIFRG